MLLVRRSATLIAVDALAVHMALEYGRDAGVGRSLEAGSWRGSLRVGCRSAGRGRGLSDLNSCSVAFVGSGKNIQRSNGCDRERACDDPEPSFPTSVRVQDEAPITAGFLSHAIAV
jgi:hypothetical protein